MKGKLLALAPGAIIVTIEEWVKKGPVYDVLRAYRALCAASENKETLGYVDKCRQTETGCGLKRIRRLKVFTERMAASSTTVIFI